MFICSSSLTALAVLLMLQAQWLTQSIADHVSRFDEGDSLEAEHCTEVVQQFRRPLVTLENRPEKVAEVIADAIRAVLKRSTDQRRSITFFGAASLQTPAKGWIPVRPSDTFDQEEQQSPHQIYQGALEAAASSRAHVDRYVHLMSDREFEKRSSAVKNDYLRWLKNQISQMTRNENYVLIDSPRAPQWGASGARIMAGEVFVDLTHKSGAAVVIRDELIAKEQLRSGEEEARSAKPENITLYSNSKSLIPDLDLRYSKPGATIKSEQQLKDDLDRLRKKLSK